MSGILEFLRQNYSPIRVKWLRLSSIKGKILIIFAVTFLSISALTAMNFWNLSTLKTRMVLSEGYDDLLNNILELRRFEKNFLIYHDNQNIIESKEYLNRIDNLVGQLSEDLPRLDGKQSFADFQATLLDYRNLIDRITEGALADPEILRNLGKRLTDLADHFREIKRTRIHATIARTSILPFAFFVIFLFLMALVLWLISQGLLKPLDVVMETTRLVGRGDFRPINYDGVRLEEIAGLIEAFNRMAEELETNQEDLIQARKIAAIGTFTAGIAHELNNPINNIALTAESFREEYGDILDANCTEMLGDILSQAERAADIVKNLLDFSRQKKQELHDCQMGDIVKHSLGLVANQLKISKVRYHLAIADNLPLVSVDAPQIQQVMVNLFINAIQAMEQGGELYIGVALDQEPDQVMVTVRDTGAGIKKDILPYIFDPFFTTKSTKGTGLGLSVSYGIIQQHHGEIAVESEEGQGTSFTIKIPAKGKDKGD